MIPHIVRAAVFGAIVLSMVLQFGAAGAQENNVLLADEMPAGVSFQTLAVGHGAMFRWLGTTMRLDRIQVACGEVTGELFGFEQLVYVEYGAVEVRDWESGETIATLAAGESFGPAEGDRSFFLASPKGKQGSVLRLTVDAAVYDPEGELPKVTYKTTDCGSGAISEIDATSATIETLFNRDDVQFRTEPPLDEIIYIGMLTVEPGASIGRPYAGGGGGTQFSSVSAGAVVTLAGGFGNGSAGMAGIVTGPEVYAGEAVRMNAGGVVALENFGTTPTIALIFGTLPTESPIFTTN
jgi:hypothetical protein